MNIYSGIYKITNQANGKVYIGQSKNIYKRWHQHHEELLRNRHDNVLMQEDFNKSGIYFRWDKLELCDERKLNEREKYWIDYYNSLAPNGYNLGWQPYGRDIEKDKKQKIVGYRKRS